MEIKVLNGTLGEGSPRNDACGLIVVTRGAMSRTGRAMGCVDEGYCVQVTASLPRQGGARAVLSVERLHAADAWSAGEAGRPPAREECPPAAAAVFAAIDRAHALLLAGGPPIAGIQIRRVPGGEPGSQYAYRIQGGRDELRRAEAIQRVERAAAQRAPGDVIVVERRPSHGQRWDAWRRYAVSPQGAAMRVDR